MNLGRINRTLREKYGDRIDIALVDEKIIVSGELDSWNEVVDACSRCVTIEKGYHVVNDIKIKGLEPEIMRIPDFFDKSLDGKSPDVLIIGAGISGLSIARELMKWKLDVLIVDKEAEVGFHASGRNDGVIHSGIDLEHGTLKQKYVVKSNRMYDEVCRELDVPFRRVGQIIGFFDKMLFVPIKMFAAERKHVCGVDDTEFLTKEKLMEFDAELGEKYEFALFNPSVGIVSSCDLAKGYAENACMNGAMLSLETAVLSMEVIDGKIISVETNRGRIYPGLVINAAGTFAEDVAVMAEDRFYSIHPRRISNAILGKNEGPLVRSIVSLKDIENGHSHVKEGDIVHDVCDNLLLRTDVEETYLKEDENRCFGGIMAATFEEDYILERGRKTKNLIHCAGIQCPGLTTAPAIAMDIAELSVEILGEDGRKIYRNESFNPLRTE